MTCLLTQARALPKSPWPPLSTLPAADVGSRILLPQDKVFNFDKWGICPEPVYEVSQRSISPLMQACLDALEEDYSTCGAQKRRADARFVECARAAFTPDQLRLADAGNGGGAGSSPPPPTQYGWVGRSANPPDGVYGDVGVFTTPPPKFDHTNAGSNKLLRWWQQSLANVKLPQAAIDELSFIFDCEHFGKLQKAACACQQDKQAVEGEGEVTVEEDTVSSKEMGSVAGSVGMKEDPLADNHAQDVVSVTKRLGELGYGAPLGTLDHRMRVLQCATEAIPTFEDACDVGVVPCRVMNITCPGVRATKRSTCLRNSTSCAHRRVAPATLALDWLRAENAPEWRRLPARGKGFIVKGGGTAGSNARAWGTDWLADGLVRAGRKYEMVRSEGVSNWPRMVLTAVGASAKEGGSIPGVKGFQSGMQLELQIPTVTQTSAERRRQRRALNEEKVEAAARRRLYVEEGEQLRLEADLGEDAGAALSIALGHRIGARELSSNTSSESNGMAWPPTPSPPPAPPPMSYEASTYDKTAIEMQMTALVSVGFSVTFDDPSLCSPYGVVDTDKLCIMPQDGKPMATYIATAAVPRIGHGAPNVYMALLIGVMESDQESVTLEISVVGEALALSVADCMEVRVGLSSCAAITVDPDGSQLTAACKVDANGPNFHGNGYWLRGQVSVTRASGGQGTSGTEVAFYVAANTTNGFGEDGSSTPAQRAPAAAQKIMPARPSDAYSNWNAFYQTTLSAALKAADGGPPAFAVGAPTSTSSLTPSSSIAIPPSPPPLPANVTLMLAVKAMERIDAAIDAFAAKLPTNVIIEPMHAICSAATSIRDRIHAFANQLSTVRYPFVDELINGASNLFGAVLGDRGVHARSAVGTNALPLNVAVEVEAVVEVEA